MTALRLQVQYTVFLDSRTCSDLSLKPPLIWSSPKWNATFTATSVRARELPETPTEGRNSVCRNTLQSRSVFMKRRRITPTQERELTQSRKRMQRPCPGTAVSVLVCCIPNRTRPIGSLCPSMLLLATLIVSLPLAYVLSKGIYPQSLEPLRSLGRWEMVGKWRWEASNHTRSTRGGGERARGHGGETVIRLWAQGNGRFPAVKYGLWALACFAALPFLKGSVAVGT